MTRIFVYGTLKAGFPNHHHNHGEWVCRATTTACFPLYLVGSRHSPWLLDQPGQGGKVTGEVYAVDEVGLASMDRLERITEPNGYRRRTVTVVSASGESLAVEIYLKPPEQMRDSAVMGGPYVDYSTELAALYRPRPREASC